MTGLLLTASASDAPSFEVIQNTSIGKLRLAAAASGLETILPSTTTPQDRELTTSEPASNFFH